jgi:Flp pilus assembly protein protease CpaA
MITTHVRGVIAALPLPCWILLGLGLLATSVTDIRARRIPNGLAAGLLVLGLVARLIADGPWAGAWGLAGGLAGLLVLLYPYHRRWVGAGDVKLMASVGGWMGPLLLCYVAVYAALVSGVLSLIFLLRSGPHRKEILGNLKAALRGRGLPALDDRPAALSPPMAPAIALGVVATWILFYQRLILHF